MEQLTGYLAACGAELLRLRIRFPVIWHQAGCLERTRVYWCFRFVDTLSISLPAQLGAKRLRLALPIGVLVRQARCEWTWVAAILTESGGGGGTSPGAAFAVDWLLWESSHRWELRWGLILRYAARHDSIGPEELADIEQCDRAWTALVRRCLEPHGYVPLLETTARLL